MVRLCRDLRTFLNHGDQLPDASDGKHNGTPNTDVGDFPVDAPVVDRAAGDMEQRADLVGAEELAFGGGEVDHAAVSRMA